jgi:S1-C subfamily serine protease
MAIDGGGTNTTTTIVRPETTRTVSGSSSSSAGLDAKSLYNAVAPGVVDITSKGVTSEQSTPSPFGGPQQQQGTATGTGFVVDKDGNIVTAAHVVDGASSITVTFQDGTTRTAKLLGKDDATDVAVLKVDPSGLTLHPLALGNSAALGAGDPLAVIGDPFGYQRSISTGIVSGLDRTIQAPNGFTVAHAIQTDAAMNPGNSGGPVLNSAGQVIGIADQIATGGSADANTGVGFLVPIDLVKSELSQLKAGQSVHHAYMGVNTGDASSANSAGALIAGVSAGGPAASAGLRAGDVVTQIGSSQIRDSGDLVAAVGTHKPGDKVDITVKRNGSTQKITVTLGTQPSSAGQTG